MDHFRAEVGALVRKVVPPHNRHSDELVPSIVDDILAMVKLAIETPRTSTEIDGWLVRTFAGQAGTRAAHAIEAGDKRIEYPPSPYPEIYCRVYATERALNMPAPQSRELAVAAVAAFPFPLSVSLKIDGK